MLLKKLTHDRKVQRSLSCLPPFDVSILESIKSIKYVLHNSFKVAKIVLVGLEKALKLCQYLSSESKPMPNLDL